MSEDILNKLHDEIQSTEWEALKAHQDREAILMISSDLKLAEVGLLLAEDRVDEVKSLMKSGKLKRPTNDQLEAWNSDPSRKFLFVIVQPYVLIQNVM